MADQIPVNIPMIPFQSIASYSFIELLTRQGILEIYPAVVFGPTYILTTNQIYSASNASTGSNTTKFTLDVADGAAVDQDFDITIGKSFDILAGKAYFNVPARIQSNQDNAAQTENITFAIKHWDGTTETTVGTTTLGWTWDPIAGVTQYMLSGIITTAAQHFKVGDVLRITYAMTGADVSGENTRLLAIDPANRTSSDFSLGTRSVFYIPVKLST